MDALLLFYQKQVASWSTSQLLIYSFVFHFKSLWPISFFIENEPRMREAQQAEVLRDMSCNVMSHRGEIENDDLEEVPAIFIQEGKLRRIVVQWWWGMSVDSKCFVDWRKLQGLIWERVLAVCVLRLTKNEGRVSLERKQRQGWEERSMEISLLNIVKCDNDNSK